MIKHFAAACLFGTALVSAPAFAQTSDSGNSGQFMTQMTADQWRGSKLVGVDVYGSDNAKIGDINEVIVDRTGAVRAIVIGVGGFLGIGEKNVAIPYDKVQWNVGGNQSSGMAANAPAATAPAANTTSNNVASTATSATNDTAMTGASRQTTSAGGASLSPAPADTAASAPAATTSTNSTAAATTNQDYPDRAMVQMSKQDLQNAPEFHYASQATNASNSAKGGAGGSSLTGTNQNTTGMSNDNARNR